MEDRTQPKDISSPDWLMRISPYLRFTLLHDGVKYPTDSGSNPRGWVEPSRYIYDHELVLFRNAEYRVVIGEHSYICPPDSFIIVPPGVVHSSENIADTPGRRYWTHFDWVYGGDYESVPVMTFLPGIPNRELFRYAPTFVPQGIFHGRIAHPDEVYETFDRMIVTVHDPDPVRKVSGRAILLEILTTLLYNEDVVTRTKARSDSKNAARVRYLLESVVEKGEGQERGVQKLLSSLGMSYAHLCRVFKQEYGLSPVAYLNALKIGKAKLLLRDSSMTVSETAYQLGFTKVSYFIQLFKKATGLTPAQYRRQSID